MASSDPFPDFRTLIERSSDAYFRFVFGVGLTEVNPAFQELTGSHSSDVLRRPEFFERALPEEGRRELETAFEQLEGGSASGATLVTNFRHADGRTVWVEMFLVPIDGQGRHRVGVDGCARDVSQHLEVTHLLSRRTREQAVLLKLQREILTHFDSQVILSLLVDEGRVTLRAAGCSLYLFSEDGADLSHVASSGLIGSEEEMQLARQVVESGAPGTQGVSFSTPILLGEQTAGALLARGGEAGFEEADLDFLVALAQVAALALANLRTYREVRRQATLDGLTGAFNRGFFDAGLQDELSRARRLDTSVGLLILDVDMLKKVNDDYGHVAGDQLLRSVVNILRGNLRETDWVARYGGDEFVAVLPGCQPGQLMAVAEGLHGAIRETPVRLLDGRTLRATISVGGAIFPHVAEDAVGLVEA
ncbi:MAG: diguanylate cyclase, partial [Anaerolineales bacterium]